VLISGAGGFVGGHLVCGMSSRGHEVIALVRQNRPVALERQPGVRIVQIDLAQASHLPAGPYDAVVHCAAAIPSAVHDEGELMRINVESSRRIFDQALSATSPAIIFCSSMSVYGHLDDDVVDEATPLRDPNAYGRSKLECERLLDDLSQAHSGLRALSIRLPGVVGPGSHDNFLSDTKARLAVGEQVVVRNPRALFNNVIHIDDLERFVEHLLGSLPAGHRVATVASEQPLPIREVVEILEAATGRAGQVRYEFGGRPFLISSERARTLGYDPATVRDSVDRFAHKSA
jgi:nucleoside-diphosphate-sugar epimerase